jgi:GNAT superfamily N-acetyltransferase
VDGVPAWAMESVTSPRGATGDAAGWDLRPMALDDVEATMAVSRPPMPRWQKRVSSRRAPHRATPSWRPAEWAMPVSCSATGPELGWRVSEGRVVGVAESVRRESFWGLSMLFVHPAFQSRGVGRRLLEAAMGYAAGATQRMIQSSPDPRAMRRYFLAGLAMHPTAEMGGQPDRRAIPPSLPGRDGDEGDLELVAEVEAQLGRSRTEDVAFGLSDGRCRIDVVDSDPGRGWVLWRPGPTGHAGGNQRADSRRPPVAVPRRLRGTILIHGLTAAQQWAFDVLHQARLTAQIRGSLFVDGMAVPVPWIPSGWYF